MQNGIVFFFLLAILLRNFAVEKNQEKQNNLLVAPRLKLAFVSIALAACLSLTVFSALKAASEFFTYRAQIQENFETAERYYENAILLDPTNGSANYLYGLRLFNESNYRESSAQLQESVKKGLNTSVSYSYLITSQISANETQRALQTSCEAVKIFPRSVLMRVRYAALLKKLEKEKESNEQFEIAAQLNKKQAETWLLLVNNGALAANLEARVNKEILNLVELNPNQAVNSVLTGQKFDRHN
jgi:predicted Zn-dependent protease